MLQADKLSKSAAGRRSKSVNDMSVSEIGRSFARPSVGSSSKYDMADISEEYGFTDEIGEEESSFFDVTEETMACRPRARNNYRFRYNFQTGLILRKEAMDLKRKNVSI